MIMEVMKVICDLDNKKASWFLNNNVLSFYNNKNLTLTCGLVDVGRLYKYNTNLPFSHSFVSNHSWLISFSQNRTEQSILKVFTRFSCISITNPHKTSFHLIKDFHFDPKNINKIMKFLIWALNTEERIQWTF